ncbi:effector-associated domain EAD1-containing protein [Parafrankia sp. EUN1f]|uniref:effector-associated domain EAD1-containing protein n=1 Tax=Parafrankia sp. EUN1f TaxID=102897 RepID=UPI0001C4628E|nr:effector-associated domain EAD1-containing protein [Parafrankia sp. EUN1f]EFC83596.1 hypothetical protein FrEUN1fDRAFT_3293 [Parafrankia sp. EUN1f]
MCTDQDREQPGPSSRRLIERRLVEVLDDAADLHSERSRLLLARQVERELNTRVRVTDLPLSRQWFIRLLEICAERPGGMAALAVAVAQLEPGGVTAKDVAQLAAHWEQLGTPRGKHATAAETAGPSIRPARESPAPERITGAPNVHGLSITEVQALAAAFPARSASQSLLTAAGLAPEQQPSWAARSALEFWTEVNQLLTAGALVDGRRKILAAAAERLPENPHFGGFQPPQLC